VVGIHSQSVPTLVAALLVGMCAGFLPHNFNPARIFMGDTGAMLIGLLLAYVPLSSTALLDPNVLLHYSHGHAVNRFPAVLPLLLPVAILIIPYADLLLAVVRRTRAGMSPFAADKKHLHHRLLSVGHSHRQSVVIMYLWAALFTASVTSLSLVRTSLVVLVGLTVVAVLALIPVTIPRLRPTHWRQASRAPGPAAGQRANPAGQRATPAGQRANPAGLRAHPVPPPVASVATHAEAAPAGPTAPRERSTAAPQP
jgi:UDP-GlcNAc:undecaprenyl-phosphate GlcNAc-1-phosphate transferase